MKKIGVLLMVVCSNLLQGQDFKPYQVKSGKIKYEKLKYSTHVVYKFVNGVESGFSEQVPYVSEKVTYYWDDFGDIAFEETFQVSKFGGELLENPIKVSERLWIGEKRYYKDFKINKIYDDPFHLRLKCKENFQYYQIKGSWIETLYMGSEKLGTKMLLEKEATYYRIDNYHDIYAWKGLVLKDESFSTSGSNGPRSTIQTAKVAVVIDIDPKIDSNIFAPKWYLNQLKYQGLDGSTIIGMMDGDTKHLKQAHHKKGIQIKVDDILIFVTTNLFVGKLQVLKIDKEDNLIIRFKLYNTNYGLETNRENFKINSNSKLNITNASFENELTSNTDFVWEKDKKSMLIPQNNISLFLINPKK
ncbi:MAG: hypothetical protein QM478_00195 [Flavobacteriaceae bacterium]